MANKKGTGKTRGEALALAKQQHMAVREYLNLDSIRSVLLEGLINSKGDGNEIILLKELLKRKAPVTTKGMDKDRHMVKGAVSKAVRELDTYLKEEFTNTGLPLFLVPVVMRVFHAYSPSLEQGGA